MKSASQITLRATGREIVDCKVNRYSPSIGLEAPSLKEGSGTFASPIRPRAGLCWMGLVVLLLVFLGYVRSLHPAGMFGYFHDDTLYFSSARAIATGQGYIIPSLPGTPRQTKYPIAYSWLLSLVWKLFPNYPVNVMPAIWLTALFGCWLLAAAFQFLRKMVGIGDWAALAIVGIIAYSPHFIFPNISILSDVPFTALALTAILLADSALSPGGPPWKAVLTGCLAGLSVNTRTLGVAVVIGLFLFALMRRESRRGLIFLLAAAPFVAWAAWPALAGVHNHLGTNSSSSIDPAWNQTRLYYTSYLANWTDSVLNAHVFFEMIKSTGLMLLVAPVQYLLAPLYQPWSPGGMAIYCSLLLIQIAGMVRIVRTQGWKPVYPVFIVYSAILLLWPYPQMYRFLLLFVPLFFAAYYVELKWLVGAITENLKSNLPPSKKIPAIGLSAALLATGMIAVRNNTHTARVELHDRIDRRSSILAEKLQAYEWIRQHTDANTKIVAFEDVMLYLYTGRQAMRPISFLPSCCVSDESSILQTDLSRILDVPKHIHAAYWLMSDDYFDDEGSIPPIHARIIELQSELPLVFRSSEGHVQIYDLSKINPPLSGESQENLRPCPSGASCRAVH